MPSPGLASVDDFYRHLLSAALGDGFDDGADFLGDTTLTANELAHILGRDTQLKNGGLTLDLGDAHAVGVIDEVFCHIQQKFLHSSHSRPLQHVCLFQKSANRIGGLSAVLDPLLRLLCVDSDRRFRLGIIRADLFDAATVTRAAGIRNDDTVVGSLLRTHSSQSDLYHGVSPPNFFSSICDLSSDQTV